MKRLIILFFVVYSGNLLAQYQFPEKELCEEVKQRTLAVQLLSEETEENKFLNDAMIEMFNENWKLIPVEFLSVEEIEEKRDSWDMTYAYLIQNEEIEQDRRSGFVNANGRVNLVGTGGNSFRYTAFSFSYYNFDLIIPTEKKEKLVTSISFANGELSKIDYLFLVQQLSSLIENSLASTPMSEFYNVERNIETIKDYDLILLKDFFKEKEQDKIGEYYKNKFELVDFDRYQDIILNKEGNKGYVKIIWSNQHKLYMWVVVDAKNGDVLSLLSFGGVKFGRHHDANDVIKVKHLEYITFERGQKFNNKYK